jgi:hypothetical protein
VKGWRLGAITFELSGGIETADSFNKSRSQWVFRGIEAPHKDAYRAGDFAKWAAGVAAREEDFEKLLLLIDVCGGDVEAVSRVLQEKSTTPTPMTWLVA